MTCAAPTCANLVIRRNLNHRYCQSNCPGRAAARKMFCYRCGELRDHIMRGPVLCRSCRAGVEERRHGRKHHICRECQTTPRDDRRGPPLCARCRASCRMCRTHGSEMPWGRLCRDCRPIYTKMQAEASAARLRARKRATVACRFCNRVQGLTICRECRQICRVCQGPVGDDGKGRTCKRCANAMFKAWYREQVGIPDDAEGLADCLECGQPNQPSGRHKTIAMHIRFCSKNCRYRYKGRRRRAARKAVRHADFSRLDILERDGWMCQLCNKRIDRRLKFPHPKSASLDHIVPLSVGGADVPSNVQAAHWDCNVAKGNRPANDQLRLVG